MNEMAMPIPVPDKSALEGIAVGDKVELVFGERFEPKHIMGLIEIKKLPDDTPMNLGTTTSGAQPRTDNTDEAPSPTTANPSSSSSPKTPDSNDSAPPQN